MLIQEHEVHHGDQQEEKLHGQKRGGGGISKHLVATFLKNVWMYSSLLELKKLLVIVKGPVSSE